MWLSTWTGPAASDSTFFLEWQWQTWLVDVRMRGARGSLFRTWSRSTIRIGTLWNVSQAWSPDRPQWKLAAGYWLLGIPWDWWEVHWLVISRVSRNDRLDLALWKDLWFETANTFASLATPSTLSLGWLMVTLHCRHQIFLGSFAWGKTALQIQDAEKHVYIYICYKLYIYIIWYVYIYIM